MSKSNPNRWTLVVTAALLGCWFAGRAAAGPYDSPQEARAHARRILQEASLRGRDAAIALADATRAVRPRDERAAEKAGFEAGQAALVGTWLCDVPADTGGGIAFEALHTFGYNGTFVETSNLLGALAEGPAHGAWSADGSDYLLTFQVFVFDEDGAPAGRVRVRNRLHVISNKTFESDSTVDVILPDGSEIPNVGGGPYECERLRIKAP